MKKLLSLLGALGLAASAGSAVIACGNTSDNNKNETQALSEIVKNKDLGELSLGNAQGNDLLEAILKEVNAKNDLKITSVDVYDSTTWRSENGIERKITIKAKNTSEKFTGEVTISYSVKTTADAIVDGQVVVLNDVVVAKDKEQLTAEDLVKKVRNEVKFLKESKFNNKITVVNGDKGVNWDSDTKMGTATLSIEGWDGNIQVAYFVKDQHAKIETLVANNQEIGIITIENKGRVTEVQIKEALKSTLKKEFAFINLNEISVSGFNKEKAEAKISVKNFTGESTVKFTINEEKDLATVIKNLNLGQITIEATNAEITSDQVKNALRSVEANKAALEKEKVTDKEITVEDITNNGATIRIEGYSKSRKVTFTVKQSVASVIVNQTILVEDKTKLNDNNAKDAIYEANKETLDAAEITKDKLTVTLDKKAGTANVTISNTKFDDKAVKVTFENKVKDVKDVISDKEVMKVEVAKKDDKPTIEQLKKQVLHDNAEALKKAEIKDEQVKVELVPGERAVKVTFTEDTKYTGEVTIKFDTTVKTAEKENDKNGSKENDKKAESARI